MYLAIADVAAGGTRTSLSAEAWAEAVPLVQADPEPGVSLIAWTTPPHDADADAAARFKRVFGDEIARGILHTWNATHASRMAERQRQEADEGEDGATPRTDAPTPPPTDLEAEIAGLRSKHVTEKGFVQAAS